MDPKDFEAIATRLVGQTINVVRYFDLPTLEGAETAQASVEWWDPAVGGDRSTYGVDLVTADGQVFAVESESSWPFGLSVWRASVAVRNPHTVSWDVAGLPRWSLLVGKTIAAVRVDPSEEITPEYYHRLCGFELDRHWWSRPLGRLWQCWTRNAALEIDLKRVPANHKVAVTASFMVLTACGASVRFDNFGGDLLITCGPD